MNIDIKKLISDSGDYAIFVKRYMIDNPECLESCIEQLIGALQGRHTKYFADKFYNECQEFEEKWKRSRKYIFTDDELMEFQEKKHEKAVGFPCDKPVLDDWYGGTVCLKHDVSFTGKYISFPKGIQSSEYHLQKDDMGIVINPPPPETMPMPLMQLVEFDLCTVWVKQCDLSLVEIPSISQPERPDFHPGDTVYLTQDLNMLRGKPKKGDRAIVSNLLSHDRPDSDDDMSKKGCEQKNRYIVNNPFKNFSSGDAVCLKRGFNYTNTHDLLVSGPTDTRLSKYDKGIVKIAISDDGPLPNMSLVSFDHGKITAWIFPEDLTVCDIKS